MLHLYSIFKGPHVTGNVRLWQGVVYIPPSDNKNLVGAGDPALFNVLDTALMASRELFPSQSPLLANLLMDVNLRIDHDVFVRSREANVEIYSDQDLGVHVNRAKETLVLDGVILSERGEYVFMTRRFTITRGSATFINSTELNPILQATAGYEVRQPSREAINIQIAVGGTMRNPNISLTSDAQPPIPQSDLLSYLAFGQSSSSLLQLEGSGLTNGGGGTNLVGAGAALASRQLAGVALGVAADQIAGSAARSLGAPASRTKLYAFMLSAGLTSVAGALYAMMFGFVDPESGLGILISVKMLIMAALGGAGLLFGPLVGAAILVPLEEISNNLLGGKGAGLTFVVYGAIIVLIARFQPGGVLALANRLWERRGKAAKATLQAGASRAP